ncbi:amidase family protein, partial [Escherichia coli]
GLVGVRSPYGIPKNPVRDDLVPGGSSSGSAVAVSAGLVPLSLGTDTAGSGRVPAMLNNVVGLKPSLGLIPNTGLVPACRTLDCISVFSL